MVMSENGYLHEEGLLKDYFLQEVAHVSQKKPPEEYFYRQKFDTGGKRGSFLPDLLLYAALILFAFLPHFVPLAQPHIAKKVESLYAHYDVKFHTESFVYKISEYLTELDFQEEKK